MKLRSDLVEDSENPGRDHEIVINIQLYVHGLVVDSENPGRNHKIAINIQLYVHLHDTFGEDLTF